MRRVMVRNPESGPGDDSDRARELASERGIEVHDTAAPGDGVDLAREGALSVRVDSGYDPDPPAWPE